MKNLYAFIKVSLLLTFIFGNGYLFLAKGQTNRTWTGTGPLSPWSISTNWNPQGNPNDSRLIFSGLGGANSFNDQTGASYRRLTFTGTDGGQAYTLSGNIITLADEANGSNGSVVNLSSSSHVISAPILFNDINKPGFVETNSTGGLNFSSVNLGPNLANLHFFGGLGEINVTGAITGNKRIFIGRNLLGSNFIVPTTRVAFSGNNVNFTGQLEITGGLLRILNDNALGISTFPVLVNIGASLELAGGITVQGRNIQLNLNGIGGGIGALHSASGNNSILSDILIGSSNNTISCQSGSTLTLQNLGRNSTGGNVQVSFSGQGDINIEGKLGELISGRNVSNVFKTGTGILTLSGNCDYTGSTTASSGGRIRLGKSNVLPASTNLILNGGEFITDTWSQALGTLAVRGNVPSIIDLGSGDKEIRFQNSSTVNWSNNINTRLIIKGWVGQEGEPATPGNPRIFVGTGMDGLTEAQLARIEFEGLCRGAALLANGELVPANFPFVQNTEAANAPNSSPALNFSSYVATPVTINGCRFLDAQELSIGNTKIVPFNEAGSKIDFFFQDIPSGIIRVLTPFGEKVTDREFINLGYVSKGSGSWSSNAVWRGDLVPPTDRAVSIAHNVLVDGAVNDLNGNPLTLRNNSVLRLNGDNLIPNAPPLVFAAGNNTNKGTLRLHGGTQNSPATLPAGFSQTFGTLTMLNSGDIALGGSASQAIRFSSSKDIAWAPNALLTILNWQGNIAQPSSGFKILFPDSESLTAEQLQQIRFAGFCQGAALIPSGTEYELVPANAPFILSILATPNNLTSQAYFGSEVDVRICKNDDFEIDKVLVGDKEVFNFTEVMNGGLTSVIFTFNEDLTSGRVKVVSKDNNTLESETTLEALGYITNKDGNWSDIQSWLGGIMPSKENWPVSIKDKIIIDQDIALVTDSITVLSGGTIDWADGGVIRVKKLRINSGGEIFPVTGSGKLVITEDGFINPRNGSIFDSNERLTLEYLGSGRLITSGSIANSPRLHNLIMHSGSLSWASTGSDPNNSSVPFLTGEFRINGGSLINQGPRYLDGSTLVYATGGTRTRGPEWSDVVPRPGHPFNVRIENGTILNAGTGNRPVRGSLNILNGTINFGGTGGNANTHTLTIEGDLVIGGSESGNSGTLNLTGSNNTLNTRVIIHGDFVRHNGSFLNFSSQAIPIEFRGSGNSELSTPGISEGQIFSRLVMRKNGLLVLKVPLTITSDLLLDSIGFITTDATNLLTLTESATITGGGVSSFVNGPMRKITATAPANATGPFEFKTGKIVDATNLYRPVWVADLLHAGTTSYTAEFFPASTTNVPFNNTFDGIVQGVWSDQYWEVKKSGNGQARVGIPYAPGFPFTPVSPCPDCNAGVVRFEESSAIPGSFLWAFTKDAFNFNNSVPPWLEAVAANTSALVYSAQLSEFSPFTIGFGLNEVLPVTLLNFSANLKQTDVLLQWEIADNQYLRYFEVEHSLNGQQFGLLTKVMPASGTQYYHTHYNIAPGVHYYRLKMIGRDGSVKYSRVEVIQLGVQVTVIHGLVQNPVQGSEAKVRIFSASSQAAEAVIMDMSGRVLLNQKLRLMGGENILPLSVMPLPRGMYKLAITTQDGKRGVYSMLR